MELFLPKQSVEVRKDITLLPSVSLQGYVFTGGGVRMRPVVRLYPAGGGPPREVMTDAAGRFVCPGLTRGDKYNLFWVSECDEIFLGAAIACADELQFSISDVEWCILRIRPRDRSAGSVPSVLQVSKACASGTTAIVWEGKWAGGQIELGPIGMNGIVELTLLLREENRPQVLKRVRGHGVMDVKF